MRSVFVGLLVLLASSASAYAVPNGLIINAVEFGVAKFHRYDNKVRPYGINNVWRNYILPDNITRLDQFTQKNRDGSYTIFFSAAEEMLQGAIEISRRENLPIAILNLEAHGMPGAMWYPIDARDRASAGCKSWVDAARGSDKGNYEQYYTPVSKDEVLSFRKYAAQATHTATPCNSGLNEWANIVRRNPEIVTRMARGAELHFVSCIVGLGLTGENFTRGMAQLFFARSEGKVTTSIPFGLGDWSMPEGMGFWDFLNDQQLERDAVIYPRDKSDREVAQKGSIRVAAVSRGRLLSKVYTGLTFQFINEVIVDRDFGRGQVFDSLEQEGQGFQEQAPQLVRIPGTSALVDLNR